MYVDGFVVPVPVRNRQAYLRNARTIGRIWRKHGALAYVESMGDDVKPGKHTSFPQAVKLKKGETVWLSWALYKSRRHRDAVNARAMKDPRMVAMMKEKMPVDGKRMFFGGFKVQIDL
jgi:uncharacterized protein YbaA (DUF1428 family)